MTPSNASPEATFAETADLVACLVAEHGPQLLSEDGRHGLRELLAMEPLTLHTAVALTLLHETQRAVALSFAGQWDLPEDVAGPVVQFAMAALPEAMASAEAAMAFAWQRHGELWDYKTSCARGHLLEVIGAVDRNLRAGRKVLAGLAAGAGPDQGAAAPHA